MAGVFISYRRDDAAGWTGRIYDRAIAQLGTDHVFMDVDDIPIGADFSEVINHTLEKVDAMVVVIGPKWLDASDHEGRRRLDDPADYVRRELMGALHKGALVIPVLVDNAPMPADRDLPEELKPLAYRNAVVISDIRFDYDVGRLVDALERVTAEAQARAEEQAADHARREAAESARLEAEDQARREAEERAKAEREAQVWARAEQEAEDDARREAEKAALLAADERAGREAEEQARPREAPQKEKTNRRRGLWVAGTAILAIVVAVVGVATLGGGGSDDVTAIEGRAVLFKDTFDVPSSAWWDVPFPRENGVVRIDGSLGGDDPWVCWGRDRPMPGGAAVFLFSIADTLSIDFGISSSHETSGERSLSLWVNGPGDDISFIQWVDGAEVSSVPIAGTGQIEIGGRYYALLQHDGSRLSVALWDADSEATRFVREEQLGADWAGREWTGGLCVHRGTAFLHEYLELE